MAYLQMWTIIVYCPQLIISLILGGKSSKSASATTSPIKDTIRGSQEMIKKLMSSKDRSGLSSSSSEKVMYFRTFLNLFLKIWYFWLLACQFGYFLAIFDFLVVINAYKKWSRKTESGFQALIKYAIF